MWGLLTSEDEPYHYKEYTQSMEETHEDERDELSSLPAVSPVVSQTSAEPKEVPKSKPKSGQNVASKNMMLNFFGVKTSKFDGKVALKIGTRNAHIIDKKLNPPPSFMVKLKLPKPRPVATSTPIEKPRKMVTLIYRKTSSVISKPIINNQKPPVQNKEIQYPAKPAAIHPFFQKRAGMHFSSPVENVTTNKLGTTPTPPASTNFEKPTQPKASPFSAFGLLQVKKDPPPTPFPQLFQMHVHGLHAHEIHQPSSQLSTSKRKSKKNSIYILDSENVANTKFRQIQPIEPIDSSINYPTPNIRIPKQLRLSKQQLRNLVSQVIVDPQQMQVLKSLMACADKFSAFDSIEHETQTWTTKYAPQKSSEVVTHGNSASKVFDWLQDKFEELKKAPVESLAFSLFRAQRPAKRQNSEFDGFIVKSSEDFNEEPAEEETPKVPKILILHGPPGSGKTSAVYAAAAELGAYTFELNSSDIRSSKKLFEKLGGMGKSHLVHRNQQGTQKGEFKKSVILLDDADVLFEEEQSFWTGLDKFVETSRRPVILTCSNLSLLPPGIIEHHYNSFVQFHHAPLHLQVNALWLLGICEGHLLNHFALQQLVYNNKYDFRSSIHDLQFWCQMALGDRRSGINWTIMPKERALLDQTDVRVISHETYIGRTVPGSDAVVDFDVLQDDAIEKLNIAASPVSDSLAGFCALADNLADADYMKSHERTLFETSLAEEYTNDRILGLDELTLMPETVGSQSHELSIYSTVAKRACSMFASKVQDQPSPLARVNSQSLRNILWFLSPRVSGISSAMYNCVETTSSTILATELVPQVRSIARNDRWKTQQAVRITQEQQGVMSRRMLHRVFSEQGLDPNSFRKYLDGDTEEVLRTAPEYWGNVYPACVVDSAT